MIPSGKVIAVDTETTGLNYWKGSKPYCFTFCNEAGETGYFYWDVNPFTREPIVNNKDLKVIKRFFKDKSITKIFHNSKFDIRMLSAFGIKVKGKVHDTYFMAYALRSNEPALGLKPLAKKYLRYSDKDEVELRKETTKARNKGKKLGWKLADKELHGQDPIPADYWMAGRKFTLKYGVDDAERCMLMYRILKSELNKDPLCKEAYRKEMKLRKIIYAMEIKGVRINSKHIKNQIKIHEKLMEKNLIKLQWKVDKDFNPNSPKQVAKLIYGRLKFLPTMFTNSGGASTKYDTIKDFKHPLIDNLLNYIGSNKLINNFFRKYIKLSVKDKDGFSIIHPNFNQIGTNTGRPTCSNPNLLNVANNNKGKTTTIPIAARSAFIPRKECTWFCFDYSSQEIWICADKSKDPKMLKPLFSGKSIHDTTAEALFGKERMILEAKSTGSKTLRVKAKNVNFGMLYGIGVNGLAELTKSPVSEAADMHGNFKNKYERTVEFFSEMSKECENKGFITTAFNRKIWMDRDWGYRGCNYYVQGTASCIMKSSMRKVNRYLKGKKINANMLLTIYDELIIEILNKHVSPEILLTIQWLMERHQELKTIQRIPVEISMVKNNWAEKIKLSKEDIHNVKKVILL